MPFSSSALTRVASVKRGGGSVKCCSGVMVFQIEHLTLFDQRQSALGFLVFFGLFVASFLIEFEKSVKLLHRTGCAENEIDRP